MSNRKLRNDYGVSPKGRSVQISGLSMHAPDVAAPVMTPQEAIELAAWLVATAVPMHRKDTAGALDEFHAALAEVAEGTELGTAAVAALEDEDTER